MLASMVASDTLAAIVGDPTLKAILTGGSALTSTVDTGTASNAPGPTAVHSQAARVGDRVTADTTR